MIHDTSTLLGWQRVVDAFRPNRAQFGRALHTGFLWTWAKYKKYEPDGDLLRGVGKWESYFTAPSAKLVDRLESVKDEGTLRGFVEEFGLLGCGEEDPATHQRRKVYRGDSIKLSLAHARTVRMLRTMIAGLNSAEHGDLTERTRFAAEIADIENTGRLNDLSLGGGKIGTLLVGTYLPRESALLRNDPFPSAHRLLQGLINANTEGIRPFLYFGSGRRTRTWLSFHYLYELAYWQLADELADDRLRACRRRGCAKVFEAKGNRKKVYCSRRCLDIDKQARYYSERKRRKRALQKR